MTDILRDDVPDLLRARHFGPDWHLEYERPTTSAANQSGFHTAKSLGIHSKFLTAFDFGYVANGASIQFNGVQSANQVVESLSFPATTSAEGVAVGAIRYPIGWPRNEQLGLDLYGFTTAAGSTAVARFTLNGELRGVGSVLSAASSNRIQIGSWDIPGSTGINTLIIESETNRPSVRSMQDNGTPYSLQFSLTRQSSTAGDTLLVPFHVIGVRIYLVSTQ